jgi:CHAT domain-containing protein
VSRPHIAVVLLAVAASSPGHAILAQSKAAVRDFGVISPGTRVEGTLGAGETARYSFRAASDDYVRIVIEQPAPLTIAVIDPAGRPVAARARLEPRDGQEAVSWIAGRDGVYRIELKPRDARLAPGPHAVTVPPPRHASAEDARLVEAERAIERGDALRGMSREEALRAALRAYGDARDTCRVLDDAHCESEAWLGLGLAHRGLSENAEALAAYEVSLARARISGDRWAEAFILQNIALVYRTWGEIGQSRRYYEQAIDVSRLSNDVRARGEASSGLARIAFEYGDNAEALRLYEDALGVARSLGNRRGESYALNGVGTVYYMWGDFDRAVDAYRGALALRQAAGDTLGQASTLSNIGLARLDSGEPAAALPPLARALALARQLGNRRTEAETLLVRGRALEQMGQRTVARAAYAGASQLATAVGDRRLEGEALTALALVAPAGADAERRASDALAIWRRLGDPVGEAQALLGLASVERAAGKLDAALVSATRALELIEQQRRGIPSQGLRASYLASTRGAIELRIDLLMQLESREPGRGHAGTALQASEQARARSLLDMLAETGADIRQGVPAEVLTREAEARRRLNEAAALAAAPSPRQDRARLAEAVAAAVNDYERIQAELRARSPRYRMLMQPNPLSLEEIQRQVVDADSLLLEFALGNERSFAWVVSVAGLTSHVLPGRRVIEDAARRVHATIAVSHRPGRGAAARTALAALSDLILGPIGHERLQGKRLVIVPDGALQFVPFAALPGPARHGQASEPLIVDHEIVQLPSASIVPVLRAAADGRDVPDRLVAVLADPVLAADDSRVRSRAAGVPAALPLDLARSAGSSGVARFDRLVFTRREAEAIETLAGGSARVALDFEASRATALDPALSRYRYVHFASHALLNTEHPELSGIVLSLVGPDGAAQDGFLRLHDIYNMRLTADVVVLSACQTALGRDVRGEGLVGLTRGFMYAGAPRVVASLWDVRDEQTAELMTAFYRFVLKDGLRPAAALRAAQVAMLRDPLRRAPAYWAGFVLQGEWR